MIVMRYFMGVLCFVETVLADKLSVSGVWKYGSIELNSGK